jgi:hypothetical protein
MVGNTGRIKFLSSFQHEEEAVLKEDVVLVLPHSPSPDPKSVGGIMY